MRVLVVTNMYPSPSSPTFGVFVREQIDDLRALGVSVDVLPFEGRRSRFAYARAVRDVRQRLAGGAYEVIHAHYGLSGAVAHAQRRVPVVTTFHGSDTRIPWQREVSRWVARRGTPIFVAPAGFAEVGLGSAAVIPCGVDLEAFRPRSAESARRRLGWDPAAPVLLLPGARGNAVKGADLFDAVVTEVRKRHPRIVAHSLEGFARDQVPTVFAATDVTVMTSVREGAPVVVKESLACSTPVVSVSVGDVATILRGLRGCHTVSRDVHSLAAAVCDALEIVPDPALRRRAALYERRAVARRVLAVLEAAAGYAR